MTGVSESERKLVHHVGRVNDSSRWEGFGLRPDDIIISTPPKCGTTRTSTSGTCRETLDPYERLTGRCLTVDRVMAWNALTVLGDALWRTEAGVALPGGGSASTWVDDLAARLHAFDLA